MLGKILPSGSLAVLWLMSSLSHGQALPAPPAPQGFLVLRNGEVIEGQIELIGDRYRAAMTTGEVRIRAREVEFVCRSLDEAYQVKKAVIANPRLDDHLGLADWCERHGLIDYARSELAMAAQLDNKHPGVLRLASRLSQLASPQQQAAPEKSQSNPARAPVSSRELDRIIQAMPKGTVESFTTNIQPLLQNSCGTVGCHDPNTRREFTMLRAGSGRTISPRLTQRNIHAVLHLIDRENVPRSRLLTLPLQPHAKSIVPILEEDSPAYRQLLAWVQTVTGTVPEEKPLARAAPSQWPVTAEEFGTAQPSPGIPATSWPETSDAKQLAKEASARRRARSVVNAASRSTYVARDPFDPEIFNRRFHTASSVPDDEPHVEPGTEGVDSHTTASEER